jgi:hypothetical protein
LAAGATASAAKLGVTDEKDTQVDRVVVDRRPDMGDRDRAGIRVSEADLGAVVEQPRVAKKTARKTATRGQTDKISDISAWKAKRQKTQQPELATRGQKCLTKKSRSGAGKPYVEAVGASVGTVAFRLRWRENGKRMPPIYLSRVSKEVYAIIKTGNYEAFKQQLIASHSEGAIRARNTA